MSSEARDVPQAPPAGTELRTSQWTERHELAAILVAEGNLRNAAICAKVGISLSTLANWKHRPEFQARVDEIIEAYRATVRRRGIAILERRVDALNDRWIRLRRIIAERAESKEMAGVPGGSTGLIVKLTKSANAGDRSQSTDDYVVDSALLKELREHEKQAAKELGQWAESRKADPYTKVYITLGPDDL